MLSRPVVVERGTTACIEDTKETNDTHRQQAAWTLARRYGENRYLPREAKLGIDDWHS